MKPTRRILLFVLPVLLMLALPKTPRAAQDVLAKPRIVVASNIRVRSEPNTAAAEVAKLQLGVIVHPVEQTKAKEKLGAAEDYWYRITLAGGKTGWIFGAFTLPFDASDRAAIYKRIASDRLKVTDASFSDSADLTRFLTAAIKEVRDQSALAWLELSRLLAMRRAAEAVPIDQQEQPVFKEFFKANEASLVYHEPGGMWLVRSELFWNLQKKYAALPIAGQIAWEGAENTVPGECEGYPPCHVARLNLTKGKYLQLYPRGARADEALAAIIEELQGVAQFLTPEEKPTAEDKREAHPEIATLRATISKTTSAKRTEALALLARYEQYYR